MSTGQIEAQYNLSDDYFAEGLTIWNNSIIQLTWKKILDLFMTYKHCSKLVIFPTKEKAGNL